MSEEFPQTYWIRRPPFNPIVGFASFYALESLVFEAERAKWKGARFQRFWEEVNSYKEFFDRRLADLLQDYLALICFGEARWAIKQSEGPWILDIFLVPPEERIEAYLLALDYDPEKFLPLCKILFEENDWVFNYGGELWADLAEIALKRKHLHDSVFCDRVIQLQHNTGSCFNKNCLIQHRFNLGSALAAFSYDHTEDWLQRYPPNSVVARFARWAGRLGLLELEGVRCAELRFPPRLEWGRKAPRLLRIKGPSIVVTKDLEGRKK